ncbi:MAG: hypothetical protein OXI22_05395, partial [Defluviicoccus sp.]|nr:hypothetical protein [Defluviicoccus sp.]
AFAAGDRPVGIGADAHAAALAWMPPGFAAFDTGGVHEDADGAKAGVAQAAEAVSGDAASAAEGEALPAETGQVPNDPPVAESAVDRPATAPSDEHPAGSDGIAPPAPVNGHDAPPDPMAIPEFLRRVH